MDRDHALAAYAAANHRVVDLAGLRTRGFTDEMIRTRERRAVLHRRFRGVWAHGSAGLEPLGAARAGALAVGPDAETSHATAVGLWGMRDPLRHTVHVTVSRDVRDRPGIEVHHSRTLTAADCTRLRGVPVTTPARSLLDYAGSVGLVPLEAAVDRGLSLGLLAPGPLEDVLARSTGRYGAATLREALGLTLTRSELERMFLRFVRRLGLPQPETNVAFAGYEVDVLWPDRNLGVELDSWRFHRTRRAFERDHDKDLDLGARGVRVVRVTYRQLTRRPAAVAARLRAEHGRT